VVLSWMPDWSWGLPLLVLTIVAHVSAIVVTAKMLGKYHGSDQHKASLSASAIASDIGSPSPAFGRWPPSSFRASVAVFVRNKASHDARLYGLAAVSA
jgi:hypothetical protein